MCIRKYAMRQIAQTERTREIQKLRCKKNILALAGRKKNILALAGRKKNILALTERKKNILDQTKNHTPPLDIK